MYFVNMDKHAWGFLSWVLTDVKADNSPTRGVMAEVKTELLWTTNVTPAPTTMAMYPVSQPNGYGRSVEINSGEI